MPTLAVTGGAGFIGLAIARRWSDRGWTVNGMDRVTTPAAAAVYTAGGGALAVGDVTDDDAVAHLVEGADLVIHTAAIVTEDGDWVAFDRVNARAPRRIGELARAASAAAYVHLSSVMVHGFDFPEGCAEDGPLDPASNPYCASKIRSEYLTLPLHAPGDFEVFVVRPGDVYGPGSVPWTTRPVEHLRAGTFLYVDPRHAVLNHLYVDNLLDAVEVMLAQPAKAAGRPVIVTDGTRTLSRDFFGRYQEMVGARWVPALPGPLAEALVGGATRVLPADVARRLDLNRESIRYLRRRAAYSSAFVRSLGWNPAVTLDDGMSRCESWLRETGLLAGR